MMPRTLFCLEVETTQPERNLRGKREEKVSAEYKSGDKLFLGAKPLVHEVALFIALTNC